LKRIKWATELKFCNLRHMQRKQRRTHLLQSKISVINVYICIYYMTYEKGICSLSMGVINFDKTRNKGKIQQNINTPYSLEPNYYHQLNIP
jgi:hypothetical protein